MPYNKEAIYDEQIAPLMNQILQICKNNDVQMLASFALMDADPNYKDEPMLCTSYVHSPEWNSLNIAAARQQLQV